MLVLRVLSRYNGAEAMKRIEDSDAVVIKPDAIASLDEVLLAEHLAKKAFENKTNIANKFKYEFLLWLAGKRDIKSAITETMPDWNEFFVVAFSGDEKRVLKNLEGRKVELGIKKQSEPLRLERISLSRIR